MVGLLDIADVHEELELRGTKVRVVGLSGESLVSLLSKFPEVRKLLSGHGEEITQADWMKLAPAALAAIMAAGTGNLDDPKAEEVARQLSAGEQAELIDTIVKLTFPRGVGPFVETLTRLAGTVNVSEGSAAPGWVPGTRLPVQSKKSSPTDTLQK